MWISVLIKYVKMALSFKKWLKETYDGRPNFHVSKNVDVLKIHKYRNLKCWVISIKTRLNLPTQGTFLPILIGYHCHNYLSQQKFQRVINRALWCTKTRNTSCPYSRQMLETGRHRKVGVDVCENVSGLIIDIIFTQMNPSYWLEKCQGFFDATFWATFNDFAL